MLGIMRHCFFHGGGGPELPASSDGDKAESFCQFFPADAAGAPRPGFPGHGKTEREMSKSWSKLPARNMRPIFATKHLPVHLMEMSGGLGSPPPMVGEYADEILAGLGFQKEEIEELRKEQVI